MIPLTRAMKHTETEEVKACSAVGEPFQQFEPMHLPLSLAI